jgi:hypothetical protein
MTVPAVSARDECHMAAVTSSAATKTMLHRSTIASVLVMIANARC